MKNYFEARKLIETKIEGEYETQKFHIARVDIEKELFDLLYDICEDEDDYESAYYNGIINGIDELYSIETDNFIDFLKEKIEEWIKDYDYEEKDEKIINAKKLMNLFNLWKGYSMVIKIEEENDN